MFSKKISIASVCAALVLIGCSSNRFGGPAPAPGPGPTTISKGCHPLLRKCIVEVKVASAQACGFSFDPDPVVLKKSWQRFVIVWRLPVGYEFRDGASGDGIKFAKEPDENQFEDGYATDSDDGDPPSGSVVTKHRYRWVYKNDLSGNPDRTYHYLAQFHRKSSTDNTPVICDPAISNLGGN